jgi:predicted RNase H-like nuclease
VCHPTIVPNRGGQRKAGAGLGRLATSVSRPMFRSARPAIV